MNEMNAKINSMKDNMEQINLKMGEFSIYDIFKVDLMRHLISSRSVFGRIWKYPQPVKSHILNKLLKNLEIRHLLSGEPCYKSGSDADIRYLFP